LCRRAHVHYLRIELVGFSVLVWYEAVLDVFVPSAFNLPCFVAGEMASEEQTATQAAMERYSLAII
jgi:hypothetical protein